CRYQRRPCAHGRARLPPKAHPIMLLELRPQALRRLPRRRHSLHASARDALGFVRARYPQTGMLRISFRSVAPDAVGAPAGPRFRSTGAPLSEITDRVSPPSNSGLAPHTIVALVKDRPGVLVRIAACWQEKGFNIRSMAVGASE